MTRPARRVRVTARAKLNLGLAVGPRRRDGFHELATLFQSISLADTLTATRSARGFTLRVRHDDAVWRKSGGRAGRRAALRPVFRLVPSGRDNLVLRAARLFAARTGWKGGARFALVKRIPAQAGLGGGSADAAAALRALERLSGIPLPRERRLALAAELGSDVPFAALGGTALGLGRGEILTPLGLDRPFRAIVVAPSWRVPTADAFLQIDRRRLGLTDWKANLRFARLLGRGRVAPGKALRLGNAFEDVLGEHREAFLSLRDRLEAAGAKPVGLSGSGSAVFGIVPAGIPADVVASRLIGTEPRTVVKSERTGGRLEVLK